MAGVFRVQSERAQLVLLQPGLDRSLWDYCNRNKDHLAPWEPDRCADYYLLSHTRARIGDMLGQFREGRALPLVVLDRQDNSVIATVNVSNIVRGIFQAGYLGYGLDQNYQGQGYMTEILTAGLPVIFERLRLHRLMANYIPQNQRSGALLKRLGFIEEGRASDYLFINGAWRDHILTAKTNPNFQF